MPWKGVTVSEQRQRFIEDYVLNYYSVTELADRFSISRKTAHKWINRYLEQGPAGLAEQSRRPRSCPWQTDPGIADEIVALREKHPSWGPKKLLDVMGRREPTRSLPSIPTAARILSREGLIKPPGLLGQAGGVIDGRIRDALRASRRGPTISGQRTTRGNSV